MNNTLTNGLALLTLVANEARPHGVTELARMADLPKSHVHRLLQSLVEARYLDKDSRGRYMISVGALRLGRELLRNFPIRRLALSEMMRLAVEQMVAFSLAAPFGNEAISIAHFTHDGNLRDSPETLGSVLAAHSSASGKLFLAHLPEDEVDAVLAGIDYEPRGPNTHRDAASLKAELPKIRQQGYSINDRENGPGGSSIAVPIFNPDGAVIAALGASGLAKDLNPRRLDELATVLGEAAGRIETLYQEHLKEEPEYVNR
ncbi:IclR family transcriptional regulator [Cerasicoccus fimbriatus]|uniref:IclR family transcriptional regulator n=1 Tax=Cerasicoccus fimbriatus TaxID=3014554 RepID=UPI0022B5646B|nr:IclR family transcriptional regulator [Cerasicoccus sp. TK19100]